jgi:hypothetical protein
MRVMVFGVDLRGFGPALRRFAAGVGTAAPAGAGPA